MSDDGYLEFVLDQLSRVRDVTARRMFGAHGLYAGDVFFAIVDEGRLYFVTDDETVARYLENGMKAFEPNPGEVLKHYYEVPVDVVEDDSALCRWAEDAVEAQRRRKGSTGGREPRSGRNRKRT